MRGWHAEAVDDFRDYLEQEFGALQARILERLPATAGEEAAAAEPDETASEDDGRARPPPPARGLCGEELAPAPASRTFCARQAHAAPAPEPPEPLVPSHLTSDVALGAAHSASLSRTLFQAESGVGQSRGARLQSDDSRVHDPPSDFMSPVASAEDYRQARPTLAKKLTPLGLSMRRQATGMLSHVNRAISGDFASLCPSIEEAEMDSRRTTVAPTRRLYAGSMPGRSSEEHDRFGALGGVMALASHGRSARMFALEGKPSWSRWAILMREWLLASVIIANAMTIGVSVEVNPLWVGWLVIDSCFSLVFLIEMVAKMHNFGILGYFRGSVQRGFDAEARWRIFEFFLVGLAICEVCFAGTQITKDTAGAKVFVSTGVFRLTRIAKIIRLCRLTLFSELLAMINGAFGGLRTLLWSMFLIALPLYVVALLLREFLGEIDLPDGSPTHGAELFQELGNAWFTLFRCTVGGECTTADGKPIFVLVATHYGWAFGAVYCLTMVLMSFGLFNVITAIFVENTVAAAKFNHLHQKRVRLLDTQTFAEKTSTLIEFVWRIYRKELSQTSSRDTGQRSSLGSDTLEEMSQIQITPEFFAHLRRYAEFQDILTDLDVSDEDQLDLFDTLDVDGGGTIDIEEMVVGICKLRGDARRSDIVGVSLIVRSVQLSLTRFEQQAMDILNALQSTMPKTNGSASAPRHSLEGSDPTTSPRVQESTAVSEPSGGKASTGAASPRIGPAEQRRVSM